MNSFKKKKKYMKLNLLIQNISKLSNMMKNLKAVNMKNSKPVKM